MWPMHICIVESARFWHLVLIRVIGTFTGAMFAIIVVCAPSRTSRRVHVYSAYHVGDPPISFYFAPSFYHQLLPIIVAAAGALVVVVVLCHGEVRLLV